MAILAGTCTIVPDFTATGTCTRVVGTPVTPEPLTVVGNPSAAVTLSFRITVGGAIGVAQFIYRINGAAAWEAQQVVPSGGILNSIATPPAYLPGGEVGLGSTGLRARFTSRTYLVDEEWSYTLTHPVGYPLVTGTGFAAELAAAEAVVWWATVSGTTIALPDAYAMDTRTTFQSMYTTSLAALAARCNALAVPMAAHMV